MSCQDCGSDDTEVMPAESEDEQDILHCHGCGSDEPL